MRIWKDANEYIKVQNWARKTTEKLGYAGTEWLRGAIDATIKEQGEAIDTAIKQQGGLPSGNLQAFDIDKLEDMSDMLTIALNESRVEGFMALKHSQDQRRIREKRRMWKDLTPGQRSERDQKIFKDFKKTHLTKKRFAEKHAAEHHLSPRQVRRILSKGSWPLTG